MGLPKFDYFAPKSLEAALSLMAEKGEGAHLFAGGTDLMVMMSRGRVKPKALIALQGIDGLNEIRFDPQNGLTIGATAHLADVASHPDILNNYPSLPTAILHMANVEVRNMGTVAGNLCNAAPSADTAPPLITMEAKVTLLSLNGERQLPLDDFFRGPGLTAIEHGEILTAIHVPPPPPGSGASYKRISARCGVDIAAGGVGVMCVLDGETFKIIFRMDIGYRQKPAFLSPVIHKTGLKTWLDSFNDSLVNVSCDLFSGGGFNIKPMQYTVPNDSHHIIIVTGKVTSNGHTQSG